MSLRMKRRDFSSALTNMYHVHVDMSEAFLSTFFSVLCSSLSFDLYGESIICSFDLAPLNLGFITGPEALFLALNLFKRIQHSQPLRGLV